MFDPDGPKCGHRAVYDARSIKMFLKIESIHGITWG